MVKVTLSNYKYDRYYSKIVDAFKTILKNGTTITSILIFQALKLLSETDINNWEKGKIPYLEKVIKCNLNKASRILQIISFHAHDLDMKRIVHTYKRKGKNLILQFTKTNNSKIEKSYSTYFVWMRKNKQL